MILGLMESLNINIIYINENNITYAQTHILAQKLDVLVYMALPTEKLSLFMSLSRLAHIQIQFG